MLFSPQFHHHYYLAFLFYLRLTLSFLFLAILPCCLVVFTYNLISSLEQRPIVTGFFLVFLSFYFCHHLLRFQKMLPINTMSLLLPWCFKHAVLSSFQVACS
jgi:multisubunit Na+/H+ antiporter MnhE subunit